ncbi:MAG: hypothetical protein V4754_21295 [Pseudomonadota bacterium]
MHTSTRTAATLVHGALIVLLLSGCGAMGDRGARYGASGSSTAGASAGGAQTNSAHDAARTGTARMSDLWGRQDTGDAAFDVSNDAQLRRAAEQGRLPK